MDTRASEILRRHDRLKSERSVWDSHWQEIAERIWPDRALFLSKTVTEGGKRADKIFDSTAARDLSRFGAAMEWMLTPRAAKWHRLRVTDDELNERPDIQQYLDDVTDILFKFRYSARANFASQMQESYLSLGAFGSGAILVEDMLGTGIRYRACDLSGLYFCESRWGMVDTAHREFEYTARQAMQAFDHAKLPEKIHESAKKSPDTKFCFVHCVQPAEDQQYGNATWRGMPFASWYVSKEGKQIVDEGGYRALPYAVGRYITTPGETYGRSPAMLVLPEIKMLNEMRKSQIRQAHLAISPPLLLQDDGALQAFDLRPGALNYGGVDERGTPLVHELKLGGRFDLSVEMIDDSRKQIDDAFLVTLFQILVDSPQMTATEAMLRAQEKGALLAPTAGRQQSEMIGPIIERELDILARAGMFPPMPDALKEAGGDVDIEYVSPLSRAQQAEDGVAIMRTFEAVAPLAQIDPRVLSAYDVVEAARELGRINGIPAKIIRSNEQIAALEAQHQQQQMLQQILQAAPIMADTANTMAKTQQVASQGVPAVQP